MDALHRRLVAVALAAGAFGAVFVPLGTHLRADIDGPLGVVPPAAAELLALVAGPGLALAAAHRLTRDASLPVSSTGLAVVVGVASVAGAAVGSLAGSALWRMVVALPGSAPRSPFAYLDMLTWHTLALWMLPMAAAVAVGVFAGIAVGRMRAVEGSDHGRARSHSGVPDPLGEAPARLLGLALAAGAVAGFAALVQPYAAVFSAGWTLLPWTGYALLGGVVVPLGAAVGASLLGVAPVALTRRGVLVLAGAAVAGHLLGYALGYGFVALNEPVTVGTVIAGTTRHLAVEALVGSALVALGLLAGLPRSARGSRWGASGA